MKKVLLLGGSAQQVIAIETAKKLGYYTILCDFLTDNPGQYVADRFYLVSTTDKDAVLEVAAKEHINGILAYASDPAARSRPGHRTTGGATVRNARDRRARAAFHGPAPVLPVADAGSASTFV